MPRRVVRSRWVPEEDPARGAYFPFSTQPSPLSPTDLRLADLKRNQKTKFFHIISISYLFHSHTICIKHWYASCLCGYINDWYMGGIIALHQTERWLASMQIHLRGDQYEPLYHPVSWRLQSIGAQTEPHLTVLEYSIWHLPEIYAI